MQERLPLAEIQSPTGSVYPPPPSQRIYCNRNLRMEHIAVVGFDMDYTLAIYHQPEMDRLSIEATVDKLVGLGYPQELCSMEYRTDFPIRGLLIDRRLGNVLKMNRYRYVKTAHHGFRQLTREERRAAYHTRRLRPGTERYHWVDTLYGLSEVAVYAAAVEHLDASGKEVDYAQLFTDIRHCADLSHQDGSILDVVVSDLPRYVIRDPALGEMFHKLRSAGKKIFLLTNSWPDYTDSMMQYLLDGSMSEYPTWRHYFDYVITASKKPDFFTKREAFNDAENDEKTRALERGRIYRGGNIRDFQKTLGVQGDEVLYVGDHIYGDVLRAKKESAWRTAMIIQEMDEELSTLERRAPDFERIEALAEHRDAVHDELREHQSNLKRFDRMLANEPRNRAELEAVRTRHRRAIDRLRAQLRDIQNERDVLGSELSRAFHPFWGSVFKAGGEVSSFGHQVEDYACLYTSRATNLGRYSPVHYYQSPRDRMPHEM